MRIWEIPSWSSEATTERGRGSCVKRQCPCPKLEVSNHHQVVVTGKETYQPSASCYRILVGIPGSHLSAKPIPWTGAFPEYIKNSFPKFLFPWWWISSKSITIECVTLLPPRSHHQIWTALKPLELCFWLILYLACSRESSDSCPVSQKAPAQTAGSEQWVSVSQRLFCAHPACGCLSSVYHSASAW